MKEKITVFVSTSYLDEAERCTRIALIHRGSILVADEPLRIRQRLDLPMIEISTPEARAARDFAGSQPGVRSVGMYGERVHIAMESLDLTDVILDGLKAKRIPVEAHREIVPSLEDVFIARVKESEERGEAVVSE
jgi:ABC-2 type transport system ATP-binding protein